MNISELIDFSFLLQTALKERLSRKTIKGVKNGYLLQTALKERLSRQILAYALSVCLLQTALKERLSRQITDADGVPLVREVEIPKRTDTAK